MSSQPTPMLRRRRRWCQSWRCSVTLETTWTLSTCWGRALSEVRGAASSLFIYMQVFLGLNLVWILFVCWHYYIYNPLAFRCLLYIYWLILFYGNRLMCWLAAMPSQYWPLIKNQILESQYHPAPIWKRDAVWLVTNLLCSRIDTIHLSGPQHWL